MNGCVQVAKCAVVRTRMHSYTADGEFYPAGTVGMVVGFQGAWCLIDLLDVQSAVQVRLEREYLTIIEPGLEVLDD